MTMEKQRSNPKFVFLFGGEYNLYYRWKVTSEQAGKRFVFVTGHFVVRVYCCKFSVYVISYGTIIMLLLLEVR